MKNSVSTTNNQDTSNSVPLNTFGRNNKVAQLKTERTIKRQIDVQNDKIEVGSGLVPSHRRANEVLMAKKHGNGNFMQNRYSLDVQTQLKSERLPDLQAKKQGSLLPDLSMNRPKLPMVLNQSIDR